MKVLASLQSPYRDLPEDFEKRFDSVVTTPYHEIVDRSQMPNVYRWSVDEYLHAARVGFDGLTITEHGQSSYDVMPNPDLVAAILAHQTSAERLRVAIGVLGRSLGKSKEPLRIAEEYAMLDCISDGRLIAGLPVGLSYDANLNSGVPPIETRPRYAEGRALLEKAWSAREPFAWNGRYSQYPAVNIWPRPVQDPRPPFWVPGAGSPGTMKAILDAEDVYCYLSWFGAKLTGPRIFDRFWGMAEEMGRDANPYRLAFLQVVCVADTDAEAERLYAKPLESHFRQGLGSIPGPALALPGYVDIGGVEALIRDPGDFGLVARLRTATYKDLVDTGVAIVGSPESVRDQLLEFVKEFRIGNLLAMLQVGSMSNELTKHNIGLFAEKVLPALRPVWDDEGWEHRWWPSGCEPPLVSRPDAAVAAN